MSNKLYVGNLSFELKENDLETEFGNHGTVSSVKIITDFETGRSKGFGFIEMGNADEAEACISSLDGKEIGGRALRVNIAQDKKDNRDSRGGGGGNRW